MSKPFHPSTDPPAALVLFCRKPAAGQGKRRLARSIGAARALAVEKALLECALEDAAQWPGQLIISPARAAHAAWAAGVLSRRVRVLPQPQGGLGERIAAVDAAARREGCAQVLIIGSDAPSMRPQDLCAAADALEHDDVVLIPSTDGGVTLMGSRRVWPDLSRLPWSEPTLGAMLARCCRSAGRDVATLTPSYDVDELTDLVPAARALEHDARPARRRLYALLASIVSPYAMNMADA